MEIGHAFQELTPHEKRSEEAQERAISLMTTIMLTAIPIQAYCLTDEEWTRTMPDEDNDTADRQFTNCVIDELGGPGEFITAMTLSSTDTAAELRFKHSEATCATLLDAAEPPSSGPTPPQNGTP